MNEIFKFIAPKDAKGAVVSVFLWTGLITLANIGYVFAMDGQMAGSIGHVTLQGITVGGPFVAFFVAVSGYQLRLLRNLSLLSRKDGLTGLNNRRTFMELAQKRLDNSGKGVLVLLDADHFKRVNDRFGHSAGDHCLEEISHRLKWNLRAGDVAGRLGGEEFAILFAGATIEQARVIGQRIGQPIPFRVKDNEDHLAITLSMGAVAIDPEVSLDAHLIRADDALYIAKDAGRARMVVWTEDLEKPNVQSSHTRRKDKKSAA
uniref:GGDEF domain-containing protein n=2 Tax=Yoonia sp. TaxID=2212373 RepID=UPI004048A969|tara:strand:+ start:66923 stop:67705 length:783 start_codon:yes stop_codon:yes gene_type:complete